MTTEAAAPTRSSRTRRLLGVAAAVALITGQAVASAAGPATAAPATAPTAAPAVRATATPYGVQVRWRNAPERAAGFTVTRTGGDATKVLTPKPIPGDSYVDVTAQPGVSYTYTVTVAVVRPEPAPRTGTPVREAAPAVASGDTLGTATATGVRGAPITVQQLAGVAQNLHTSVTPAALRAAAPRAVAVAVPDLPGCQLSGTLAVTTTLADATACPSGYQLTGDVTVPAGITLTVGPGTTVWVNPGVSLLVQGTLSAVGTASQRIVFTSAKGLTGSGQTPAAGDWGTITFAPTGAPSTPSGALSYVDVSYGTGVVADSFPLPVSQTTFDHMAGTGLLSSALTYLDPSGSVSVSHLSATHVPSGVVALSTGAAQPFTLTDSTVTADLAGAASVALGGAGSALSIDVERNSLTGGVLGFAAATVATGTEAPTTPAAVLTGTVKDNTALAASGGTSFGPFGSLGAGLLMLAANLGQPDAAACSACNSVAVSGNAISGPAGVVSGAVALGATSVTNAFSGGTVDGGLGVVSLAGSLAGLFGAGGGGGGATASPTFSGTTITSAGPGLVNAALGQSASARPTLASTTVTSQPALSIARAAGPRIDLSELLANVFGSAVSNIALGSGGPSSGATALPTLTASTLTASSGTALYNYAEGNHASSPVESSFTLSGSSLTGSGPAISSETRNTGPGGGVSTPSVTGGSLSSTDDDAVVMVVNAQDSESSYAPAQGPATLAGQFSDVTVSAQEDGLNLRASSLSAPATVSTTFDRLTVTADGTGLEATTASYAGSALTQPTIRTSTITAADGTGVDLSAEWLGIYGDHYYTTQKVSLDPNHPPVLDVSPVVQGSTLTASHYNDALALAVRDDDCESSCDPWPLAMHVGGQVIGSTLTSADEDGLQVQAYCEYCSSPQGIRVDTAVTNTAVTAGDDGIYVTSHSGGNGVPVTLAPTVIGTGQTPVTAGDEGIDIYANTYGAAALASTALTATGLHLTPGDHGIETDAYSEYGDATDSSVIKGNTIDAIDDGINQQTSAYGPTALATASGTISDNTIVGQGEHGSLSTGDGIYSYVGCYECSSGGQERVSLSITGNTIRDVAEDGLDINAQGLSVNPGVTKDAVHILGNTITGARDDGIDVYQLVAEVTGNKVTGATDAGLRYTSAPAGTGLVSCNLWSGNALGITYSSNDGHNPTTTQNSFVALDGTGPNTSNLSLDSSPVDATNNWWGTTDAAAIAAGISGESGPEAFTPFLSSAPVCLVGQPASVGGGGGGPSVASSGGTPTPDNPVVVTVTHPEGGQTTFADGDTSLPSGFTVLGKHIAITTPAPTTGHLTLAFTVHPSAIPGGPSAPLTVFRDGVAITACTDPAQLGPDPCVASDTTGADGLRTILVRSSHASTWSVAAPAVTRLAGADRIATAIRAAQAGFPAQGAGAVMLARADDYPDALAGAPLAAATNAPLLLTDTANLAPATAEELQRVLAKGKSVYVLGGPAAVSSSVESQVAALGYSVTRLAGANRYATATAIAGAVGAPSTVLLTTGTTFADALAAGAAAPRVNGVVLLTAGNRVPAETAAYLAAHSGVPMYAVGGPAAAAVPAATAVAGADRYATAVAVAEQFFPAPTVVGLATGTNFPDALAAGARLARLGAPLLLTDPARLPGPVSGYLTAHRAGLTFAEVYGGPAAVSDAVASALASAIS